jgi:hypothetical protein
MWEVCIDCRFVLLSVRWGQEFDFTGGKIGVCFGLWAASGKSY